MQHFMENIRVIEHTREIPPRLPQSAFIRLCYTFVRASIQIWTWPTK
jgi:hypothetical protein